MKPGQTLNLVQKWKHNGQGCTVEFALNKKCGTRALLLALESNKDEPFDTEAALAALGYVKDPAISGVDLIAHLHRQRAFSLRAFGPGNRWRGVLDHIRKELDEIANDPADLSEWIDVVLLAFDGAWRQGHSPEQIAAALQAKLAKNEARTWPDWRTQPTDRAIEHVREEAKP